MGTVLVDVESAGSTGCTTTERTYDSESDENENWFTERELMGPLHYNDKDEGGVYTKNAIKGMLSRPCKHNAVLRAAGELEYRKVKDTKRRRKGKRQRSGVTTTTEVDPADVNRVMDHIMSGSDTVPEAAKRAAAATPPSITDLVQAALASMGSAPAKAASKAAPTDALAKALQVALSAMNSGASSSSEGAVPPAQGLEESVVVPALPAQLTEDEKRQQAEKEAAQKRDEAIATRVEALTSAKSQYDKTWKDLSDVDLVEARLRQKGWGSDAVVFLNINAAKVRDKCTALFKDWVEMKAAPIPATASEVTADKKKIDEKKLELVEGWKYFKENILVDFLRFK